MPSRTLGATDAAPGTSVVEGDGVERASPDLTTVTTADPGTGGTTLAVTATAKHPSTNNFKIDVVGTSGISERMLVTAGAGTASYTVTRALDGTTAVAHSVGAKVALVTWVQRMEPVDASKQVSFRGRASTFRTPGRAGTTGQKIFAIHNATGSTVNVDIDKMSVDMAATAAAGIAPTVQPPVVRVWKFTAVPTNGTALTKVAEDSILTSKSAVTVWGDASADSTGSGVTLTITLPAGNIMTEEFGPRILVVGTSASTFYEGFDRTAFVEEEGVSFTLRPLEGVGIFLDYTSAASNPTTHMWIATVRWAEWTQA